ncbi:MAG TPA: LmbU family transcriptional regulator [Thermoleophilaceae bacterium]
MNAATQVGNHIRQEVGPREPRRVALTPVSWSPSADALCFKDWVEQGRRLGVMGRGAAWWIGDWVQYGNVAYGERYVRAARITGYDVQTLMNMVYVASRFEISRRREKLSWSHHSELAAMEPQEQDRWLAHAERERLSVRDLREELRRDRHANRACDQHNGRRRVASLPPAEPVVCPECGCLVPVHGDREAIEAAAGRSH